MESFMLIGYYCCHILKLFSLLYKMVFSSRIIVAQKNELVLSGQSLIPVQHCYNQGVRRLLLITGACFSTVQLKTKQLQKLGMFVG